MGPDLHRPAAPDPGERATGRPAVGAERAEGEPVEPPHDVAAAHPQLDRAPRDVAAVPRRGSSSWPSGAVGLRRRHLGPRERRGGRRRRGGHRRRKRARQLRGRPAPPPARLGAASGSRRRSKPSGWEGEEEEGRAVRHRRRGERGPLGAGQRAGGAAAVGGKGVEVDEAVQPHHRVEGAAVRAPGRGGDGAAGRGREVAPPCPSSRSFTTSRQEPSTVPGVGEPPAVRREAGAVVDGVERGLGQRRDSPRREVDPHQLREAVAVAHGDGGAAVGRRVGVAQVGVRVRRRTSPLPGDQRKRSGWRKPSVSGSKRTKRIDWPSGIQRGVVGSGPSWLSRVVERPPGERAGADGGHVLGVALPDGLPPRPPARLGLLVRRGRPDDQAGGEVPGAEDDRDSLAVGERAGAPVVQARSCQTLAVDLRSPARARPRSPARSARPGSGRRGRGRVAEDAAEGVVEAPHGARRHPRPEAAQAPRPGALLEPFEVGGAEEVRHRLPRQVPASEARRA